jgi:hypothetical protein
MKNRLLLLAGILAIGPLRLSSAQTTQPVAQRVSLPATQPIAQPMATGKIELGKLFRSRVAGIEFYPPAGGLLMRQPDGSEIVRFVYNDRGWDIHVKSVPLHIGMPLAELVRLSSRQLLESSPSAEILDQKVIDIALPGKTESVGMIQARQNVGVDRMFTQLAFFREDDQSYYLIQMGSPTSKAKGAASNPPDDQETQAKDAFAEILPTVHLLDREALRAEQDQRLVNTRQLWVQVDQKKILQAIDPLHFVRIIRDGKDVGFVQYNERRATHMGRDGIEIIVRSRVMSMPADPADHSAMNTGPAPEVSGIVVPKSIVDTVTSSARGDITAKVSNLYTDSTFFCSFERLSGYVCSHEDWLSRTQIDDQKAGQISELGLSDLVEHRVLDARIISARGGPAKDPVFVDRPEYSLNVSQYVRSKLMGQPFDAKLVWFYLPQGLGQILPRLLPGDVRQYMFATYVSSQHNVMGRYVDVGPATEADLGSQRVNAIPISDRIGIDGIPTIQYVSRSGEWLGSVNEEAKLQCLPATADELKAIWPGFKVSEEPPLPQDAGPKIENRK